MSDEPDWQGDDTRGWVLMDSAGRVMRVEYTEEHGWRCLRDGAVVVWGFESSEKARGYLYGAPKRSFRPKG